MAYAHVAHDNVIADDVVVANAVQLAGHVVLGRYAVVGGCTAIHQFTRVGDHAFIGGASVVVMDVPPFCKASGNRARLMGLNSVGLKRRGFGERHLRMLRRAYRLAFRSGLLLKDAVRRIREEVVPECEPACLFADFLESSTRGITR
ncbi:MAG: hypothetical protein D6806_07505 [Deltaproteobacteria bacterium]|nr:MAG: hypothetical protein D6806_07505 [Deltaproteobacteria bacterium]